VAEIEDARRLLLRSFRWCDGHADFAAAFRDPDLLAALGPALAGPFRDDGVTAVVGMEARGFIVGTLVARAMGVGLVLARKPGAVHPGSERARGSAVDWRRNEVDLRVSRNAVSADDRVLIVDDWIETGNQAVTAVELIRRLGADVVGVSVLVDGCTPEVRELVRVVGLVRDSDLPSDGNASTA